MAMMLPGALVEALNLCGFNWPSTNEDQLWQWGEQVRALADAAPELLPQVEQAVSDTLTVNQGPAIEAYREHLDREGSPLHTIEDLANLCNAVGIGAGGVAAVIVALKVLVIGQLILLAASIAAAIASAGIGSLGVPAVKKAVEIAVEMAIEEILEQFLTAD